MDYLDYWLAKENVVLLQNKNKVFVTHSFVFSLNKNKREIPYKSYYFLIEKKKKNEGDIGNSKRRQCSVCLTNE